MDAWCTGPGGDRRRYRVPSPEPLAGGQSYVFDARTAAGERVALKLLGEVADADEQQLRDRWAHVMAAPHPNVARPIELFRGPGLFPLTAPAGPPEDESDLLYAATAWTDGRALRAAAPLGLAPVARLATDLGAAVAHLHERCGLLHRDVHPGNVVVDADGHATLIDLGAVRPDDGGATGTVAGLLGFIAPELLHGPADRGSDVWSVAMTIVFAVLGHPGGRQTDAQLRRQLRARLAAAADPDRAVRLLLQGIAADPDDRPVRPSAWAEQLADAIAGATRRRRRALAGAVAVVLTAGVVAAFVDADRGTDDDAAAAASTTTPAAPACIDAQPGPDVAAVLDGDCVVGAMERFGDADVHPVAGGVVLDTPAGVMRLTTAQYLSYREIAGRSQPENAAAFGGYPTASADVDGAIEITLSGSGILIGARSDSQSFWLPASVVGVWRERGGALGELGLPMTNPFFAGAGVRQDFERGYIVLAEGGVPVPDVDPAQLEIHIDADPGAPLRGLELRGRIVRQPTGTAWYVDDVGQRRWVPDGSVYDCAGGDAVVIADMVPGSAVATLPLGPPMAC